MSDFSYNVRQNKHLFSNDDYSYKIRANDTEFVVTSKKQLTDKEIRSKIQYNNEKNENEFVLCDLDDTSISVMKGKASFVLDKNSSGNKLEFQGFGESNEVTVKGDNNKILTGGGNDKITIDGGNNNYVSAGDGDDTITVLSGDKNVVAGDFGRDNFVIKRDAKNTTVNAKENMPVPPSLLSAAINFASFDTIKNDGTMTTIKKDLNDKVE